jgi:large subunit ribosomal protein L15
MGRTEKHRASRTYGRGKKAGRGAGKRGGRGNAGLHKHKYISTVKYDPKHFGRYGFKRPKSPSERSLRTINVGQIDEQLDKFIKKGYAKKVGNKIELDLSKAKIDKLLGSGNLTESLIIRVDFASEKAKSKVADAGGEIKLAEDTVLE